jgi:aminoglycoside 6'-N-acetyltransferase I
MNIRPYRSSDRAEWQRMRQALWPDQTSADMDEWLARPDAAVLVAERPGGGLGGFAEVGERSIAQGCSTSPVAYLEGWYVDPDLRGQQVGAGLLQAIEAWARRAGYRELASDTTLGNEASQRAHQALGFIEVERAVQYRKPL